MAPALLSRPRGAAPHPLPGEPQDARDGLVPPPLPVLQGAPDGRGPAVSAPHVGARVIVNTGGTDSVATVDATPRDWQRLYATAARIVGPDHYLLRWDNGSRQWLPGWAIRGPA